MISLAEATAGKRPLPAVNGTAVNGTAVNGTALDGTALDGTGVNGSGVNGTALDGSAANGTALDGSAANVPAPRPTPTSSNPLPAVGLPVPPPGPRIPPADQADAAAPTAPEPVTISPELFIRPPEPVTTPPAPGIDEPSAPIVTAAPGRLAARRARAQEQEGPDWIGRGFALARAHPLAVILIAQAALSLRLVWSNTAFTDEALYLWSGRLEWSHWLHRTPIPDFPHYFSGAPVIYPPLGAMAAALGGLAGARILSLGFMLTATVLLHGVTRRLFDRRSAHFAAALFAGLGATQFLGAFATYDALSLMLLALATWLSVRAAGSRLIVQIPLLLAAASALALADAAKYAAALFDIVVILVAGLAAWRAGSGRNGIAAGLGVSSVLGLLLFLGIRLGGSDYWQGISSTTLSRPHGTSSAAGIIVDSFGWSAFVVILALIGAAVAVTGKGPLPGKLCACVLAGAVALAPADQARIHVFTSLFKHIGFGAWFAAPVAGYALASLADAVPAVKKEGAVWASTVTAVAGLLLGSALAQAHFASWPDSTQFVAEMRILLPVHQGPVLADEDGSVIEFYAPNELGDLGYYGPWFLRYRDPDTGRYLFGRAAYADAFKHRFFSIVALSFDDAPAMEQAISRDIRAYGGYQLVDTLPYRLPGRSSAFRIWIREGP